ncbi:MAG: hypothetical protein ABIQ31_21735 [Ferruginibacter sp.]
MKTISSVLLKVFVKQFYIINAGFLLFLFFVFFGMVHGGLLIPYHRSLISGMLVSPIFMAVVWVAWLFYNIKCMLFCAATIKAADSGYLFTLRALSPLKQRRLYFLVCTLQYLPVLIYSCFIIYMAINRSMFFTAILVTAYQLLLIALAAAAIFISINKGSFTPLVEKIASKLNVLAKLKHRYFSFLWANILHNRKMPLVLVKIFSILLLSVSFVRNGDKFDEDLFSIFFQLIFVSHAMLVFYSVDFAEAKMQFSRNLPLDQYKIIRMYLFTYGILLLPETAFILINNHGNLPVLDIPVLYGTAVSILFLYTALLYACKLDMENYMLFVFVIFIMDFFLQKTGWHFLTMLAILITGIAVFKSSYYLFERE